MTPAHDKVILRKPTDDDVSDIVRLLNNKKIWDNVRDKIPFPYREQDAIDFIGWVRQENPLRTFAIEYNGELAGFVGLLKQEDVYRLSAEIGYWLGEPFWNKGIATRAVKLMVDYGFKGLGLVRIFTGVFDFNKPSRRVLEKAGFELECISKKALIKNGVIRNEYRYSLVLD